MAKPFDDTFVQQLNANLGIAHKIARVYVADADHRDDAIQEMMYQLCRAYPSFEGRAKFSTWMYRVCLNTALTYKRNNRRHQHLPLSVHDQQLPEVNTGHDDARMQQLFDAISTLSPVNKAVVLLYLDDLSYDEIAAVTGLSKANVSVKLVRIKKELETLLRKQQP